MFVRNCIIRRQSKKFLFVNLSLNFHQYQNDWQTCILYCNTHVMTCLVLVLLNALNKLDVTWLARLGFFCTFSYFLIFATSLILLPIHWSWWKVCGVGVGASHKYCVLNRRIPSENGRKVRQTKQVRLLAPRGHVTNASFQQWVGVLLMPKIILTEHIKIILHPKFERYWEIFNGTLIFQLSSMICIGNHVGGHTLALQHSGQTYFLLISC